MPLSKLQFKPGVNRERTRYGAEGTWWETNNVRFRQGLPEKIGGWQKISDSTFTGVCRSLRAWSSLGGLVYRGVGTAAKFYVEFGGDYFDITPIRLTTSAGDPTFDISSGDATVTVNEVDHGAAEGDYVTFSSAAQLGTSTITADVLNQEYVIATIVDTDTYTIEAKDTNGDEVVADETVSGGGGASTVATYQINAGGDVFQPLSGWGADTWSSDPYGETEYTPLGGSSIRLWSQSNFGEDLIFAPRGGNIYYWDLSAGLGTRGEALEDRGGASDAPVLQNYVLVSDVSRFVLAFGANELGSTEQDPMLIRWSDQENAVDWTPSATNQAGSLRLSKGTEIVTAEQSRQEILVWTDTSLYSLQFRGIDAGVWGAEIVGDNITIASQNARAFTEGVTYWMGKRRFYVYDGRTQQLQCDLLRYVFNDFNEEQYTQVFAGTNEEFGEVWWFYCSSESTTIDRYVIFNYREGVWYHGSMARTAWQNPFSAGSPFAATYNNNIVQHEFGTDDFAGSNPAAISAYALSTETDIEDGERFSFVRRMLPDVTFSGSDAASPQVTITLYPLKDSGAGYNDPDSEGGVNFETVTRTATSVVEQYTSQINVRVRGRQLAFKIESSDIGVHWQLGTPRIDIRTAGRRG